MTWLERRQRNKAGKLMARGEVSRAIKLLEKAQAWDALADAYRRQGKTKAAELLDVGRDFIYNVIKRRAILEEEWKKPR